MVFVDMGMTYGIWGGQYVDEIVTFVFIVHVRHIWGIVDMSQSSLRREGIRPLPGNVLRS